MPSLKVRKFSTIDEVQFFLEGGIVGGGKTAGRVYGLVGKTMTFSTPAASVTFVAGADTNGQSLTFAEIKAQIETAVPTLVVRSFGADGAIGFIEKTPTNGVAFPATSEDAKLILGFPKAAAVTGKVYKTPTTNTAPCLVSFGYAYASSAHIVTTWE